MRRYVLLLSYVFMFVFVAFVPSAQPLYAQTSQEGSASVLVYHRFGENKVPSTNVRLKQFDQHLKTLKRGPFVFPTVEDLVARIAEGKAPQDRSILITVDDAYLSAYKQAWPRLKKRGIPLAVFVSTDEVDNPGDIYMNWAQLRQLKKEGVYIGHHGASHKSLITVSLEEARADLEHANARFRAELGEAPSILAWPYGEFSKELMDMAKSMGFKAALSQSSGSLGLTSALFALPRFAINEQFGVQDRFDLVLNTKALAVKDVLPQTPLLDNAPNPPLFGFTLINPVPNISELACYPSDSETVAKVHILGTSRVEVRFDTAFPEGRSRVNCTLADSDGRWYWIGMPFFSTSQSAR